MAGQLFWGVTAAYLTLSLPFRPPPRSSVNYLLNVGVGGRIWNFGGSGLGSERRSGRGFGTEDKTRRDETKEIKNDNIDNRHDADGRCNQMATFPI